MLKICLYHCARIRGNSGVRVVARATTIVNIVQKKNQRISIVCVCWESQPAPLSVRSTNTGGIAECHFVREKFGGLFSHVMAKIVKQSII